MLLQKFLKQEKQIPKVAPPLVLVERHMERGGKGGREGGGEREKERGDRAPA